MNFDEENKAEIKAWYKRYYSNERGMKGLRDFDRHMREMEMDYKLPRITTKPNGMKYFYRAKEWNYGGYPTVAMEERLLELGGDSSEFEAIEREEIRETLNEALKKLTSEERELLRKLYAENKTQRAVGQEYGIDHKNILMRKNRVLKKIRIFFQEKGYQTP